jgi:hypothetical protein
MAAHKSDAHNTTHKSSHLLPYVLSSAQGAGAELERRIYVPCDPRNPDCKVLRRPGGAALLLQLSDRATFIDWRTALLSNVPGEYGVTLAMGHDFLGDAYLCASLLDWTLHLKSAWLNLTESEAHELADLFGVAVQP